MIKYSRQREAIKQCLMSRHDHPTAEMIYRSIKDDYPNISLGTVYRNLSLLSELGEIDKITVTGGPDRFDGKTVPHYHFFCRKCGCIMDLELTFSEGLNALAAARFPGVIEKHTLQFTGICPDCLHNK